MGSLCNWLVLTSHSLLDLSAIFLYHIPTTVRNYYFCGILSEESPNPGISEMLSSLEQPLLQLQTVCSMLTIKKKRITNESLKVIMIDL